MDFANQGLAERDQPRERISRKRINRSPASPFLRAVFYSAHNQTMVAAWSDGGTYLGRREAIDERLLDASDAEPRKRIPPPQPSPTRGEGERAEHERSYRVFRRRKKK